MKRREHTMLKTNKPCKVNHTLIKGNPKTNEEILQDRIDETFAVMGDPRNDKSKELQKAFIKVGVNPKSGEIMDVETGFSNIYAIADVHMSVLQNRYADFDNNNISQCVTVDVARNALMQHFTNMARGAFTDAVMLANVSFTNTVKGLSTELHAKLRGIFGYYYNPDDDYNTIFEPFAMRLFNSYSSNAAIEAGPLGEIPVFYDLRVYRMCEDESGICMAIIPILERNFRQFKELIGSNQTLNADEYNTCICIYNNVQLQLLYSLENIVTQLFEEVDNIIKAGGPNVIGLDPIKVYNTVTHPTGTISFNRNGEITTIDYDNEE